MRAAIFLLAALMLCGCASKRQSERSAVTETDSAAVSAIVRAEGAARPGLWTAAIDADSVRIPTPEGPVTLYGVHASADGAQATVTEATENRTDSAAVSRRSEQHEAAELETVAVYDPPDLTILYGIAAVALAAIAAVYFFMKR